MNGRRVALAAATLVAAYTAAIVTSPPPVSSATPTLAQLIGQKLVVSMSGLTPDADLLYRIRHGQIGGVILFGSNISSASQVRSLTYALRSAAAQGGQPHFLVAVDQEGGSIKRIPWAPPTLSPPQMGKLGSSSTAQYQGQITGSALRGLGINVDFAPVADVPASTASFMYQQGRTWSFSTSVTTSLSNAFATGLEQKLVAPSMKHFPGLGLATRNTDLYVVTINASKTTLSPAMNPYRTAIVRHIPLIMLSNATYPAYDAANAAGWSYAIAGSGGLLRHGLGYTGATITDSLDGTAHARGVTVSSLAIRSARAGTDFILSTGSESSTRGVYSSLLQSATAGSISQSTLLASYNRILAFKANSIW